MGSSDPCLLLIDVQRGFDEPRWGPRNEFSSGRRLPAEDIHRAALASLHGEFATVADTEALIGPGLPWHRVEQA
jgi:nicotinamidase-related amidase